MGRMKLASNDPSQSTTLKIVLFRTPNDNLNDPLSRSLSGCTQNVESERLVHFKHSFRCEVASLFPQKSTVRAGHEVLTNCQAIQRKDLEAGGE